MAKPKSKAGKHTASTLIQEKADYILGEMINAGRSLVAICSDEGIPSRSAVYRWLADQPAFAARVDRAREMADHAIAHADKVIEKTTPETANADRIKLVHLHWKAARMFPKKYSERRTTELTGKDGGPVQVQDKVTTIDASKLTYEQRQALRQLLERATAGEGNEDG
jgi:hypothetical protein